MVRKTYTFKFDKNNNLTSFIEKPDNPYNNYIGTGNIFFRGNVVTLLNKVPINNIRGEKELVDLFKLLVKQKNIIKPYIVGDKYINLNTSEDFNIS